MPDFRTNWITQLRKGIIEFCVLKILQEAPLYGYDIVRNLRTLDIVIIGEGTIYPLLSRLRREDFVETYLQESSEGPARKYYQLTVSGEQMLKEMRQVWETMIKGVDNAGRMKGNPQ